MPGADDPSAVDFTFAERTAAMQAGIVDRVELAVGLEQR